MCVSIKWCDDKFRVKNFEFRVLGCLYGVKIVSMIVGVGLKRERD